MELQLVLSLSVSLNLGLESQLDWENIAIIGPIATSVLSQKGHIKRAIKRESQPKTGKRNMLNTTFEDRPLKEEEFPAQVPIGPISFLRCQYHAGHGRVLLWPF